MMMMRMGSSSGGGGCSLARYDAGKMDRILLRFRPIAPKPSTGGASSSGGSSPESNSTLRSTKLGRGKRRYKNNNDKNPNPNLSKRRKTTSSEAVTLPLLPETAPSENGSKQIWLNFNRGAAAYTDDENRQIYYSPNRTVADPPRVTCVTLECLTHTMVEADALGVTDDERMINLERDTCPGFVSDRFNRVTWSNAAFREMVDAGNNQQPWVGMKESAPLAGAFSCRVRVRTGRKTLTVPCDVWRMNRGGFAWRLDVNAALSLALC